MAKHKSVLKRLEVKHAGRKRACHHNPKHEIRKGEWCLEVTEGLYTKGYCVECARAMLGAGQQALAELAKRMDG